MLMATLSFRGQHPLLLSLTWAAQQPAAGNSWQWVQGVQPSAFQAGSPGKSCRPCTCCAGITRRPAGSRQWVIEMADL